MATVEVATYTNETFKQYLMQLSTDIVWKDTSLAKVYEANADPYLTELFITANRGTLNFDVVRAFPRVVLQGAGVAEEFIDIYASDKNKIPVNMRSHVVNEYAKAFTTNNPNTGRVAYPLTYTTMEMVINEETGEEGPAQIVHIDYIEIYHEENNYYRMLNGLPDIEDTHFIYNTDPRWDTSIPIHEMNIVDRLEMESTGYLATIIAANPKKKYLKHLGIKMIDIYTARVSERFDILWMNGSESSTLESDFIDVYNGCKRLVNGVYYSNAFRKGNKLYENFLAMSIVFMTIQTMQYHYLSVDVIRDFYDTESLKYVYDSYGVPFYNEIPLDYHRKIVKNINRLIGYKGSSKVFYDLFNIFDLAQMDIYSYYITKVHLMDHNGNPTFIPLKDSEGNIIYDDKGRPKLSDENYSIAFAKSEIYQDPSLSVADEANRVDYTTMTEFDPYWVEDANLIAKLNDESFNFTESKYIGVQTVFDLLRIAYENAYVFKMIADNKSITDTLAFRWSELNLNVTIFDLFIYLASLFCRTYGYEGQLSSNLPYTAAVLGYDFAEDLRALQSYIANDPYLSNDSRLKDLILNMNITNINSISTVFDNIYEIQDLLILRYTEARSKEEFEVYRNLYNSLMTSKIIDEVFQKHDGTVATTFEDLLGDTSPELMTRLASLSSTELEDELRLVIDKIEELITAIRYLPFSAGLESSRMIESLFRILSFFKSAKAELTGYNIIYQITMRGMNFMKFLDDLVSTHTWGIKIDDEVIMIDLLRYIRTQQKLRGDILLMLDNEKDMEIHTEQVLKDYIRSLDDELIIVSTYLHHRFEDDVQFIDTLVSETSKHVISSIMGNKDKLNLVDMFFPKGEAALTFSDLAVFTDVLIMLASVPYMSSKLPIEVIYQSLVEKIKTPLKTIMTLSDRLIPHNEEILDDKLEEFILREYSRMFFTRIDDTMLFTDKLSIHTKVGTIRDDSFYTNGVEDLLIPIHSCTRRNDYHIFSDALYENGTRI